MSITSCFQTLFFPTLSKQDMRSIARNAIFVVSSLRDHYVIIAWVIVFPCLMSSNREISESFYSYDAYFQRRYLHEFIVIGLLILLYFLFDVLFIYYFPFYGKIKQASAHSIVYQAMLC